MTGEQNSPWIANATDADFETVVLQRSNELLCLVDFWAEWCAPCRTLGPILEEIANEYAGKFLLVKVDTEKAQQAATSYGVQSIPAVFAIHNGEPIDGFNGVMPKEQIMQWIDRILDHNEFEMAKSLIESDPKAAETKLTSLAASNPNETQIQITLAELLCDQNRDAESSAIIATLEDRGFLEPEAEKIKAKLDMKSKSDVDLESVKAKADAAPDDLDLKLELADAYVGNQEFETAFEICLEIVRRDKKGVGDKARQLMVDVFRTLPNDSELTHNYRRKLSTALY